MPNLKPDVRIGSAYFKLGGERGRELLGLFPMRQRWRSPDATAEPQVFGEVGVENIREEDLIWRITSWAGGEGQRIMVAGDDLSGRRYDRSVGVDLTDPSRLRLGKAMHRQAISAGIGTTTLEADTFADVVGTSVVSGSDRILDDDNDEIGRSATLSNGTHQVEFWGYSDPLERTIEGNTLVTKQGDGEVSGDDLILKMGGKNMAYARTAALQTPGAGQIEVIVLLRGRLGALDKGEISAWLQVRNQADEENVAQVRRDLRSQNGDYGTLREVKLVFTAETAKSYWYRVVIRNDTAHGVLIEEIKVRWLSGATVVVKVLDGAATLATQTVDLTDIDSTQMFARLNFAVTGGPKSITFRFARTSDKADIVADKAVYSDTVTMGETRLMELGQGGNIWLVDFDAAAAPSVFKWDAANNEWDAIANIGGVGAVARAMAHSDTYEYVLLDDGNVHRLDGGAASYLTAAVTNAVGLAVGADRVWILAESATGGTHLHRAALDNTAAQATTDVYTAVAQGVTPDTTLARRIAGTDFGCVFFVNRSTRCEIFEWNEATQAGRPISSISGFQGRAITHGDGYSFIGGELAISGGGTEAAMFVIDHASAPVAPEPVNVDFERDDDPDSYLTDLQFYGRDVYALAHLSSSPPRLRLWRLSLRAPGGLFLEHEVIEDTGATARALAVTADALMMCSDNLGPWVAQTTFITDASPFLRTSLFQFQRIEEKALVSLGVDALFPANTQVELRYSTDDGVTWESAGVWTETQVRKISTPAGTVGFRHLGLEIRPRTTNNAVRPEVYMVQAVARIATVGDESSHEHVHDLVLWCGRETATLRVAGQMRSGAAAAAYVKMLADSGQVVEFEDFFSDDEQSEVRAVQVRNPDNFVISPGESLLRVHLVEA